MAQLSRPYQIGLATVAVLAAAWLLLFSGHRDSSTPSAPSSSPAPSTPAHTVTAAAAPAKAAEGTAGSATGSGSASSLGGLGKAVEKARGAVAVSKAQEQKLAERSTQASSVTTSTTATSQASAAAPSKSAATVTVTKSKSVTKTAAPAPAKSPTAANRGTSTARQHQVEAQLAQGKVAVILFWNPRGSDDRSVRSALHSLRNVRVLRIAINEAPASQVASFGSITRGVQVYGTPTLLILNKAGKTRTLTGLQDRYGIVQAIRETRHS